MSKELLDEITAFLKAKSGKEAGDLLRRAAGEISYLDRQLENLESQIHACEREIHDLEYKIEDHDTAISDDIHTLLDLVERPTGTLHAAVPPSPAAERALIKLYDAVGRKL